MYNYYEHDSRINPENRYKDIFVEAHRLSLGYQVNGNYKKIAFDIYDQNRRALLVEHF